MRLQEICVLFYRVISIKTTRTNLLNFVYFSVLTALLYCIRSGRFDRIDIYQKRHFFSALCKRKFSMHLELFFYVSLVTRWLLTRLNGLANSFERLFKRNIRKKIAFKGACNKSFTGYIFTF